MEGTGSEETCRGLGLTQESVYRMGGGAIGNQLLAFFLIGVIALAVVLFLETYGKTLSLLFYQKLNTIKAADLELPEGEDDDVQAERTRIMCELQGLSKDNAVVCTNLRKKFGKVTAVQNLTLGRLSFEISESMISIYLKCFAHKIYIIVHNNKTKIFCREAGYCLNFRFICLYR